MKKRLQFIFFLFTLLFVARNSFAQKNVYVIKNVKEDEGVYISTSGTATPDSLIPYWRFSSVDDDKNKLPETNDENWDSTKPNFDFQKFKKFNGFGWFRLRVKVETIDNFLPSIGLNHNGASEIYLDGKIIGGFGKVSNNKKLHEAYFPKLEPVYLPIQDTMVHLLAIKYSEPNYKEFFEKFDDPHCGFDAEFSEFRQATKNLSRLSNIFFTVLFGLSGILISLALVHFTMYAFERKEIFNFYQGLFTLIYGMLTLIPAVYFFITDPVLAYTILKSSYLLIPTFFVSITALTHSLYQSKGKKYLYFVIGLFFIGVVLLVIGSDYAALVNASLSIIVFFGSVIQSIKAIRGNRRGANFVGTGILTMVVCLILLMVVLWITARVDTGLSDTQILVICASLLFISLLSTPFSVSFFLAKEFATRSKKLQEQIVEIEKLSEQSIKQEQEKKVILEKQNELLESQVKERTLEISNQNKILEHQKKEITDSINYSKRIQKAILPEASEIKESLPNSFVLYEPKDIVSGDFYFYHKTNEGCIIAAVDCTGHGVPGAFMSLIGKENLDKAVNKSINPGTILSLLNQGVKKSLRQNNSDSTRDGMDVALCKIEGKKISFSGANRPLWILRNDSDTLEEIKATKCAIGGLTEDDQVYKEHELELREGDKIYLFSDGYCDQFGGPNQKKLGSKKLKEFLIELRHSEIIEQGAILKTRFLDWQGNIDQVDDILMIGISF